MKTLLIYSSFHHLNTQKIALAMAEVLNAETVRTPQAPFKRLQNYDTVGIGSGIYFGRFDKRLFDFVNSVDLKNKNVFVFSTSGLGISGFNNSMTALLVRKKANVIGRFHCRGYDTYSLMKAIGGIAKGHPNAKDIENAKEFAREIMSADHMD